MPALLACLQDTPGLARLGEVGPVHDYPVEAGEGSGPGDAWQDKDKSRLYCVSPDQGAQLWGEVGENRESFTFLAILAVGASGIAPKVGGHRDVML